jgi:hypothetical protein
VSKASDNHKVISYIWWLTKIFVITSIFKGLVMWP